MRLSLVYPSYFWSGQGAQSPSPPLGVYALAAVTREAGFEVDVVDPSRYGLRIRQREVVEEMIRDVDVVGISSTTLNWHEAHRLIGNIKDANQDVIIVVGGVHATHFDRYILESTRADYVVRGEAERCLPQLLETLRSRRRPDGIPGVSYRSNGEEIVQNPPDNRAAVEEVKNRTVPLYELIPEGSYNLIPLETSRGCPNSCIFCSIPYRRQWRGRDPKVVLEEIDRINRSYIQRFTSNSLLFVDDCFTASGNHVREISDGIERRGFDNPLVIEARITDLLKPDVLPSVARLNLTQIQVGIECGYDSGLKKVGKTGLTTAKVEECARRLRECDIIDKVMFSFILGLPWEGEEECLRTIDFAKDLVSAFGGFANCSWWILLPSRGWETRHSYGIDIDESFFDVPDWYSDNDLFFKVHPRLNLECVQKIKQRVRDHQRQGVALYGV